MLTRRTFCKGALAAAIIAAPVLLLPRKTSAMLGVTQLTGFGAGGGAAFRANAVRFDGSNDYLTRGAGLTGAVDNKQGLISFWFKFMGGDGVKQTLFNSTSDHIDISKDTDNKIYFLFKRADGDKSVEINTTSAYTADGNWHHLCASWDTSALTSSIYVDDGDDLTQVNVFDRTIDWTDSDFAMGADTGAGNKINAEIAEFYLDERASYFNIATEVNRRKFIDDSAKPVDLGSNGSTPTGDIPMVFFSGPTATWHTNNGGGGGFTENGALTDAANSPSD